METKTKFNPVWILVGIILVFFAYIMWRAPVAKPTTEGSDTHSDTPVDQQTESSPSVKDVVVEETTSSSEDN